MNGYTRVKNVSTPRSRSMDFSDLSFLQNEPKQISNYSSNPPDSKICHDKKIPEKSTDIQAPTREKENEDSGGEIFGVILQRKCSVSSTSSRDYFTFEQNENASSLQSTVKRVLSMKRSSSVSEGYCRIHHQSDPTDDDERVTPAAFKTRSIKKKGKFLRACRRIFGF